MLNLSNFPQALDLPNVAQSLDFTCAAACFDSMYQFFLGHSLGELHFANELETLNLGYTPPVNVVNLAKKYGFISEMIEHAKVLDFVGPLKNKQVIFVTWWYEDSGHYSLVKQLEHHHITLMDPWTAREGKDHRLSLQDFIPNWNARGARLIRVGQDVTKTSQIF